MRQAVRRWRLPGLLVGAAMLVAPADARVSADEAARLEKDLTPIGAERAGSADGRIPAWTGGITTPPASYVVGTRHPDPFADDAVSLTITADNVQEHAEHLSDGQRALFRAYPETWRMNVYPTRRSASFPQWVYEAVRHNATHAEVSLEGKGTVRDSRISSPFPIPDSGIEVIWNHVLRWRGIRVHRINGATAITRTGRFRVILSQEELGFPYGLREETAASRMYRNLVFVFKSKVIQPALLSGDGLLGIEPIDQTREPRKVWAYDQGIRRVLRLAHFAYDFPSPGADGLTTTDDRDLFNGSPDRFDWKLRGKRALYVPYNAYRLHADARPRDLLGVGHIEPEHGRYELHRVWVVEGTLKPGENHIYSRRIFYVDEDSWQILVAESYDQDGNLWRVNEAHAMNYYEVPLLWETLQVFHDLDRRRYFVNGLDNQYLPPRFSETIEPREFSPNALLYYVR